MKTSRYMLDSTQRLFAYQIRVRLVHEDLNLLSDSQLVLINFLQTEGMEFRIINCFEKFTKKLTPFFLEACIADHHCYLNQSSVAPIAELLRLLKVRFQRLLKMSSLVEPAFASTSLLIGNQNEPLFQSKSRKYSRQRSRITIDELTMVRSTIDPFSLQAIGKPKLVRHFTFKGQQRYTSSLLA